MSQKIPRLGMEQFPADLADYLQPRVARLNYLGELFQVAGHAPRVLLTFMQFTEALKQALPDRYAEVAVLTTATLMQNFYERNQHERLCIRLGFGREWVGEVERMQPDVAVLMSGPERAAQRYTMAAVQTSGLQAQQAFDEVVALLPPEQAVALSMLIGRYITHALVVNTFQLHPPVPSIWDDGFGLPAGDSPGTDPREPGIPKEPL
jgi:hypothetical protein